MTLPHEVALIAGNDERLSAPSQLTVCVLAVTDVRGWCDTLESVAQLHQDVLVVAFSLPLWLRTYVEECGYQKLEIAPASAWTAIESAVRQQCRSPWVLWLVVGEVIPPRSVEALLELTRLDPAAAPAAYSCVIRQPGRSLHTEIDECVCDSLRLQRRDRNLTAAALDEATFDIGKWPPIDCAWTEIVITHPRVPEKHSARSAQLSQGAASAATEGGNFANPLVPNTFSHEESALRQALASPEVGRVQRAQLFASLICLLTRDQNFDGALAVAQEAKHVFPTHAEILFREGLAWHYRGSLTRALGCYRAAHRGEPLRGFTWWDRSIGNYKAVHNAAVVYYELGDSTRAEQCWREVLRIAPQCRPAHSGLRRILLQEQRFETAKNWANVLLCRSDHFVDGVVLQAGIARAQGQPVEAIWQLEAALRRYPADPLLLLALTESYAAEQQIEEAHAVVAELLRISPTDAGALFWQGCLFQATGDTEHAAAAWRCCLRANSRYDVARARMSQLAPAARPSHVANEEDSDARQPAVPHHAVSVPLELAE